MNSSWAQRFNEAEKQFCTALVASGVQFLVIGGVAALYYGARSNDDSTNDIDLLVPPARYNARKLEYALQQLESAIGCKYRGIEELFTRPRAQVRISTIYCGILSDSSSEDFERRWHSSVIANLGGAAVRVVSIAELISLKLVAVEVLKEEAGKHELDIVRLREIAARSIELRRGSVSD